MTQQIKDPELTDLSGEPDASVLGAKTDTRWIDYFKQSGFPEARGLSAGMEGAVYSLVEGELVAKVWLNRGFSDVQELRVFCDALRASTTGISTPDIKEVRVVDGVVVSIERHLAGRPLQSLLREDDERAGAPAVKAVVSVLELLRMVPPRPEFTRLPVLGEHLSPWQGTTRWSEVIDLLIERRMRGFGSQLQTVVPDLTQIRAAVSAFLRTRDGHPMSLIHGDLCPANIMVDDGARPISVLDFGFLSTVGDPAFDASVASAIFNMYGRGARDLDDQVTTEVGTALGYPSSVLKAYRAVYSLLTSNAYSEAGVDGHFKWCVSALGREDVRASLGL